MHNFAQQRLQLTNWLQSQGVHDPHVLNTLATVPRELFVEDTLQDMAYADRALPTSLGQTISQPFMVAVMTQALQLTGQERVLEIGTGSGYQTAILAHLAREVVSIERYQQLSSQATQRLTRLAISNVTLAVGDGSRGWPAAAPYDRILVTAASPTVPHSLLEQLHNQGILIIPIGTQDRQELQRIQRTSDSLHTTSLGSCVFVPLIGAEGWQEDPSSML